jgi:hypothetical protein
MFHLLHVRLGRPIVSKKRRLQLFIKNMKTILLQLAIHAVVAQTADLLLPAGTVAPYNPAAWASSLVKNVACPNLSDGDKKLVDQYSLMCRVQATPSEAGMVPNGDVRLTWTW